jgi:hypothetical protein
MDTRGKSISARFRRSARSLGAVDYIATAVLVAVYVIGTGMEEGPDTSIDFYRAVATVIPTLLITVAIQGRIFELSRKVTFRHQYRTVLFVLIVFGGEAGALMTIARETTNWAAHLYVYMAVLALGLAMVYLALTGPVQADTAQAEEAPNADDRDGDAGVSHAKKRDDNP